MSKQTFYSVRQAASLLGCPIKSSATCCMRAGLTPKNLVGHGELIRSRWKPSGRSGRSNDHLKASLFG